MHTLDFTDHRRELDDNRYVYAVVSRRAAGLSVGINLNPDKVCNFDCAYCQVDRGTPGGDRQVDLDRLERELDHLLGLVGSERLWSVPPFDTAAPAHRVVRDISFAGDGEPTSCPGFAEAIARVGRLRAAHALGGVKLVVMTNATLLHRAHVWRGVQVLAGLGGELWAKLDAGTEAGYRAIDRSAVPFTRVLKNIERASLFMPVSLQAMFVSWQGEGPSDAELQAWAGRIRDLLAAGGQLREIQVYSVARTPADRRVGPLPRAALESIADTVRGLGVSVRVV